jgi:hypothetical protein
MAVKQLTVDNNEDEARNSIDNATAEGLMVGLKKNYQVVSDRPLPK